MCSCDFILKFDWYSQVQVLQVNSLSQEDELWQKSYQFQPGYCSKMLNSVKNDQRNHIGTFMYPTQVQVVLFPVISSTSYYQFLGPTPFEIVRGIYGQQINYTHAKLQVYPESIWRVWQRVDNKEAHGVSIHEYTLVSAFY